MKPIELHRREFLRRTGGLAASLASAKLVTWLGSPVRVSQAAEASPAAEGPQLSVCIEALFTQAPFEQRLAKVKAAGLKAFEFWGWRGRNLDALRKTKEELGLELAAFSCDTGGSLVASGSKDRYLPALKESIAAARELGCSRLFVTVGNELKELPRSEQHRNIVAALKAGAPLCEEAGVIICLEPLNVLVDHKGYYLAASAEAFEIVQETGSRNIQVVFDIYHQQITEGNLIQNIARNLSRIGHFHVADVPGRHQVGTGEINYSNVFRSIVEAGYKGYLGLEMWPTIDHTAAVKQVATLFEEARLAGSKRGSLSPAR
jgi:hydroxypyruvate isomerase